MDTAYKLVAYDGKHQAKYSAGKASLPGRKALLRLRRGGSPNEDRQVCISERGLAVG